MSKSPLLTIISPVYKAEKYLPACIDSILAQTFTDFELILVNDGSPDKSGDICDEYALKDQRIVVIHKHNGGASSARNAGVKIARGAYIGWVDADDRIAPDMFDTLYNLAKKYDTDIAECQYYDQKGETLIKSGNDEPLSLGSDDFAMKEFFSARMKPSLCTKLYKRELFHDVTFPPGRIHQDCYVNMKFALKPITYARTSEAKYYYIIRDNSITTMATGREIREAIYLFDYTMNLTKDKQLSKTAIQYLQNDAVNRMLGRYFGTSTKSVIPKQNIYNKIIRIRLGMQLYKYLNFAEIPLKTKISYFLMLMNMRSLQVFLHNTIGKK